MTARIADQRSAATEGVDGRQPLFGAMRVRMFVVVAAASDSASSPCRRPCGGTVSVVNQFLRRGLRAAGFRDCVSTGGEALERMRPVDGPVADVDLDLGLPAATARTPRHAVRGRRATRVVVVTARCEAADRARASALGVDGYLINQVSRAPLPPAARLPGAERGPRGAVGDERTASPTRAVPSGAGRHRHGSIAAQSCSQPNGLVE